MNDHDPLNETQADGTRDDRPTEVDRASPVPAYAPRFPVADDEAPRAKAKAPRGMDEKKAAFAAPWLFAVGGAVLVGILSAMVAASTSAAEKRLVNPEADRPAVAIADQAEVAYCTPQFKKVLERVLHACGLEGATSRHGCQPSDVKSFASISDEDFNALFTPLKDRGAVLLFDNASEELDAAGKALLEERWADRRGARYFFAVARASKSGNQTRNRALSHRRANSVKFHVQSVANDPDLDRKLGQLWLGNEFAQLDQAFCDWPNSRPDQKCSGEAINRSVFVSWVDCRL
jgi:outer membrane protein OmpA-like peptidoglycan-associated protein